MSMQDLFHHTRVALCAGADAMGEGTRLAYRNADRYVVAELEELPRVAIDGQRGWIDTRPLVDEREHPPQIIDIWADVLAYAVWRGLLQRHPAAAIHTAQPARATTWWPATP